MPFAKSKILTPWKWVTQRRVRKYEKVSQKGVVLLDKKSLLQYSQVKILRLYNQAPTP